MDQTQKNGLTKRKNEWIVHGFLGTKLWVGKTRKPIWPAGMEAALQRNEYEYEYKFRKSIIEAMKNFKLDNLQMRNVFDRLDWPLKCKECNVGKEISQFRSPAQFDIKVREDYIALDSIDPCESCSRRQIQGEE